MSVEILGLERHIEDVGRGQPRLLIASYMLAAAALRRRLNRVAAQPNVIGIPAFDQWLTQAILGTYRWALVQLSEVRQWVSGQGKCCSQSTTPEALSAFHNLKGVCAASQDGCRKRLADVLEEIDDAIHRLSETRNRIEHVLWPCPR